MLKNIVNCKNCGAPLHYDEANRKATCTYCDSEYHMDNLGILEEYKIELEIYGRRIKFYISQVNVENPCEKITSIDSDERYFIRTSHPQITLELISLGY